MKGVLIQRSLWARPLVSTSGLNSQLCEAHRTPVPTLQTKPRIPGAKVTLRVTGALSAGWVLNAGSQPSGLVC